MKAAMKHPLRTFKPEEAALFVVPALLNVLANHMAIGPLGGQCVNRTGNCDCCVGKICNEGLLRHTERVLQQSPWFQRSQGRDHVGVCSAPACFGWRDPLPNKPNPPINFINGFKSLRLCNYISFEENSL